MYHLVYYYTVFVVNLSMRSDLTFNLKSNNENIIANGEFGIM